MTRDKLIVLTARAIESYVCQAQVMERNPAVQHLKLFHQTIEAKIAQSGKMSGVLFFEPCCGIEPPSFPSHLFYRIYEEENRAAVMFSVRDGPDAGCAIDGATGELTFSWAER